jgi:anti-sigma factor RsiW
MKIDDDTLIAYLDAQLEDDAAYEAVEDALAESPALRARLQALAETGELARKAFDAKLEEAVPPQLIAAIMNAPLPGAEANRATQDPAHPATAPAPPSVRPTSAGPETPSLGARLAAWLGGGFGGAAAFASVVMLALGALIGHYLLPPAELAAPLARQGDPIRNPAVAVALQAAPSGLAVDAGNARLEIMASFAGRDGQFCREYSLSSPQIGQEIGIACRDHTAHTGWQLAFIANEPASPTAQGGYATASDRLHEAVAAFLGEHVQDGPFDAERERALIERGWTAN